MSILDKKGISVTSGFKLVSGQPLDARNVVDDLTGLQDLIDNGASYEGMIVWVKSEKKLKQFNGTSWSDISSGGSGGSGGSSSGSSDFIDVDELPVVSSADLDKIYRTPENKIISGTPISNSGTINNLYFNTLLTDDEIKEIINQLQWIDGATLGQAGIEFYPILAYMHGDYPYVLSLQRFTAGEYAGIVNLFIVNFATMEQVYNFYLEVSSGWQSFENPYPINVTVLPDLSGIPLGYQNELLKTLISSTPFETEVVGYNYDRAINGKWVEVLNEVNPTYIIEKNYDDIKNNTLTFTSSEWEIIVNNPNVKIKAIIDDGMHALFDKQTYLKVINEEVTIFACGGGSIGANNSLVSSNSTLFVVKSNGQYTVLFETFSNNIHIIEKNYDSIKNNTLTFTASEWEIIRNNPNVKVRSSKEEVVGSNTGYSELLLEKSIYVNTGIADLVLFQSCIAELVSQEISLVTLTVIRYETGQHTSIYSEINLTELANGGGGLTESDVNTLIANYMTANYGNGDEEEY